MVEEEFSNAKTSVWWDLEKCGVPSGVDPHAIAQNISSALSKCEYKGPVTINAFGDTHNLSPDIQRALSSTGIGLHHVPSGIKDASDKRILVDMLFWAVDNSAPANYLLISSDHDFASALHQLRMRRYNILLAYPTMDIPSSLFGAAKIIWLWTSLSMGEQLMLTIKDTKKLDKISDSNMTATCKGSLELCSGSSKPMLKDSLLQNINSFSGMHMKNGFGPLSDSNQARGQLYTDDSAVECSKSAMGSVSEDKHNGNKAYCLETGMPTSTSSMGRKFSTHKPRAFSPSDSDGARSSQSLQNHANNKRGSCKDTRDNMCSTRTNPNSSAKLCSAPSKTKFASGAKNVPPKLKNHCKMKSSQPSKPRMTSVLDMTPSNSPSVKCSPNVKRSANVKRACPSQANPIFQMQNHASSSQMSPADLRADMPALEKMNISSDLQQSSNFKSPVCTLPQISQLLPSEKNHQYPSHLKLYNATQTEPSRDVIQASPSNLPPPQHHEMHITHRVHMRILSLAMETLKQNMIAPMEQNLEDCIKYGEMHICNFNLRVALDKAIELKDIVALSRGGGFKVYLPRDSVLWQCVDPLCMQDGYPKELWNAFYIYLSSHEGCEAMMQSQSRYDAAQKLKKSCLKTLLLGQIIHMLHLAIKVRQWLRPHQLGWSPLSVTISQITEPSISDVSKGRSPTFVKEVDIVMAKKVHHKSQDSESGSLSIKF